MKKMCTLMAVLMAILVAGIWATGSNASSYDDISVVLQCYRQGIFARPFSSAGFSPVTNNVVAMSY